MSELEILDEQVIHKSGSYERVRRWIKGTHPDLGVLTQGLTGWETVQEIDRIRPLYVFTVSAKEKAGSEDPA